MILGGMIGFLLSMGIGISQGQDWSFMVLRSVLCAYAVGLLLRWWGGVWERSWNKVQLELAAKAEQEEANEEATGNQS